MIGKWRKKSAIWRKDSRNQNQGNKRETRGKKEAIWRDAKVEE